MCIKYCGMVVLGTGAHGGGLIDRTRKQRLSGHESLIGAAIYLD